MTRAGIAGFLERHRDALAEWVVLVAVLGIAALISYTHLRTVWESSGAPWPYVGPLLVDGLFAAAWLRMRRRRRQGQPVGVLAWLALVLALLATLAGNLAAAWVTGHREVLALIVAGWPAVAFALVWELVTGHSTRPPAATSPPPAAEPVEQVDEPEAPEDDEVTDAGEPGGEVETLEEKRERLLAEDAGRPTLVRELGITDWEARQLKQAWAKAHQEAGAS